MNERTPSPSSGGEGLGFTVVVCTGARCADSWGGSIVRDLAATVRESWQGVLVSSGCPLPGMCAGRSDRVLRTPGPIVFVQPCHPDTRRPLGDALLIGPLRNRSELSSVQAWLRSGTLDAAQLPPRLLPQVARTPANQLN
ncbi:MAG: hypothetical protein ACT4P1_06895 [Sporichthyaceae bacterium]